MLSLCLFNLYAEYIMRNTGLDEAQATIKNARSNINNLRYTDDTSLMAESKDLKSLQLKGKEKIEKKLAQNSTFRKLTYWAPKSLQMVTAAMTLKDTCSWKKSYDQPRQHIKKQRHYLADKCPSSQSYGFSGSHVCM